MCISNMNQIGLVVSILNMLLGKLNIFQDAESRRKMVEVENFHFVVTSRPKEHVHINYEPNGAGSFHF